MTTGVVLGVSAFRFLSEAYPNLITSNRNTDVLSIAKQISNNYVDNIPQEELIRAAVRGMLDRLDNYSSILTKEHLKTLEEETLGHFQGIGIQVGWIENQLRIIAPIDGTPAAKAGVRTGDQIISIDHEPVINLNPEKVVEKLQGEQGTSISLQLVRRDIPNPIDLVLIREEIQIISVSSHLIGPDFAYLRISNFQKDTEKEVVKNVRSLQENNNLEGLILDIRNNPGGMLSESIAVADLFLSEGVITYTRSQKASREMKFVATKGDITDNIPMVVLVNAGSASASEIVAGALSENGRALLIGTRTFGKGSVQSILHLHEDIAIKLTTARYFTPSGKSIQTTGLQPDVELTNVDESTLIREAVNVLESLIINKTTTRAHSG